MTVLPNKACPVVLRRVSSGVELLAFKHPLAGCQLVKGTVETDENLPAACSRELFEESGIIAKSGRFIGALAVGYDRQIWGFYNMLYDQPLPDTWDYFTQDGGGLLFSFFWLPLPAILNNDWHHSTKNAIRFIEQNSDV
tara:strand:- start:2501 stop:2917 length:417 start_codon:yes stop_codon:yes gene_type:complete